jgi:hypothetical protein
MIPCSCSLQYTTVCDMRLPANHRWDCPERARLEAGQGKPQAIAVNRSQVEPQGRRLLMSQQTSHLSVAAEREWIDRLREMGAKAAHPDDGWVNRHERKVHLAYPQFDDGLAVGDLLALGWPWRTTRLVRVVSTSDNQFALVGQNPWF